MKAKTNKSRVFLIIACVLSFIMFASSAILAIMVGFNIGGITDVIGKMMLASGYSATEIDGEIAVMIFSFVINLLFELYFALFYLKAIKYRANSLSFARRLMSKSIWHFILGSFIPAIFAMISASIMGREKVEVKPIQETEPMGEDEVKVSNYKLTAMKEAVERLRELKEKGAISEEEYYANLNKILEG